MTQWSMYLLRRWPWWRSSIPRQGTLATSSPAATSTRAAVEAAEFPTQFGLRSVTATAGDRSHLTAVVNTAP
jgi:hypothetical protein